VDVITEQDDLLGEYGDEHDAEAERRMTGCDQCGPSVRAKMHGIIGDGEIKWCFHCTNLHRAAFNERGGFLYEIRDA
jgi:hypothetical protein